MSLSSGSDITSYTVLGAAFVQGAMFVQQMDVASLCWKETFQPNMEMENMLMIIHEPPALLHCSDHRRVLPLASND